MPEDKIPDLINAIGATAELGLTFYRTLLSAGADSNEAYTLTKAFISSILNPTKRGDE